MINKWEPKLNPSPEYKFHSFTSSPNGKPVNLLKHKENQIEDVDWLKIVFTVSLLLCLQAILMVGSYSGEGKPPMFGDFEAQRHWMEITWNLPLQEWYFNTTDNDLLYWGLDYPPLTAYHSYLMGFIANKINPSWVSLHTSRGIQDVGHKLFMRLTVVVPYILIYVPAVIAYSIIASSKLISKNILFILACLYPGLIAMDCAHFQYNSISLGFFLLSYIFLHLGNVLTGSVLFVLAVNYKQMELYHSLPIFVYILARSLKRPFVSRFFESVWAIAKVGIVVIFTFLVMWGPFIFHGLGQVQQLLKRIFPFYRGLYEDKVASVWCSFSFILKLSNWFTQEQQIQLSTICVLLISMPSLLVLFVRPSLKNFRLSLFITSLVFFLFSFQVHEKSVLLPAVAGLLLLPEYPFEISIFLQVSCTSLFSLCLKDGNASLLLLFACYSLFSLWTVRSLQKTWIFSLATLYIIIGYIICLAEFLITPPAKLPHIFPLMNAFYSCVTFLLCVAYFYINMALDEFGKQKKKTL